MRINNREECKRLFDQTMITKTPMNWHIWKRAFSACNKISLSEKRQMIEEFRLWLESDDCWIEDEKGNKVENYTISGSNLIDRFKRFVE